MDVFIGTIGFIMGLAVGVAGVFLLVAIPASVVCLLVMLLEKVAKKEQTK